MKYKIPTFDPNDDKVELLVAAVMNAKPVNHLRDEEVFQTLRLLQLEQALTDEKCPSDLAVTVFKNDKRLEGLSDDDKFLALLLDADCRQTLLTTKRCRSCFGGTPQQWCKVAKRCELIETKSRMLTGDYGGRYFGRGWEITPYIQQFRKWMKEKKYILTL